VFKGVCEKRSTTKQSRSLMVLMMVLLPLPLCVAEDGGTDPSQLLSVDTYNKQLASADHKH
jgi:hypothetical protein